MASARSGTGADNGGERMIVTSGFVKNSSGLSSRMGCAVIAAACSITRFDIVPAMAAAH
jgi:hypothetical protein